MLYLAPAIYLQHPWVGVPPYRWAVVPLKDCPPAMRLDQGVVSHVRPSHNIIALGCSLLSVVSVRALCVPSAGRWHLPGRGCGYTTTLLNIIALGVLC